MTGQRSVRHLIKGLGPGGAERLLLNQVRAERGSVTHHVTSFVEEKTHLVSELEAAGATVTPVFSRGLGRVVNLRRILRDQPTDIVHTHSPAIAAVVRLVAKTLPRSSRPAVVGTEHNRWPRHHRVTRLANRLTIRFEAATIAVSGDVASTIRGARPGQVHTIVHGIDLDAVRAQADRAATRAELGAVDDDLIVICVANLRREKALDELVEAARRALDAAPQLRFVSVGQGPLAAELDRWIETADIGHRFTALGYRTDVARLLSAADVFTLSSHHEGLPVALMEAFAIGLPIVATAAGGVPDAVGDAGLLSRVGDPAALAAGYVRLADDSTERRRLAEAATRRAEAFSIERAIGEIAAIYETATSAGRDVGAGSGPSKAS